MTNRGEAVIHDVDLVDARIMDETSQVDWHQVSENEAAGFGVSLGIFRDSVHAYQQRRTAFGTALGGIISICGFTLVCALFGVSAAAIVGGIIGGQAARAFYLWWLSRQAEKFAQEMQLQAVDTAKQLAAGHPL